MWLFPISVLLVSVIVAIPLGRYLAWIMDGRYQPPRVLKWCEARINSGPQNWKQYAIALLVFNIVLYVFGYIILALTTMVAPQSQRVGSTVAEHYLQHGHLV